MRLFSDVARVSLSVLLSGMVRCSVSKDWLVRFVEHRIGDLRIIRLIQKWVPIPDIRPGQNVGPPSVHCHAPNRQHQNYQRAQYDQKLLHAI